MTTQFELTTSTGKPYNIVLPSPKANFSSKFVFSFAKSGSTLLNDLLFTYCPQMNVPVVSVFDQAFSQGLDTTNVRAESSAVFTNPGFVFSGFRHFPNFDLDVGANRCILLVRDPRDMVVSLYYSVTKSHVIPEGNESLRKNREQSLQKAIDEFVIDKMHSYVGQFKTYKEKLAGKQVKVYRYEDVIYDKATWLGDVLDYLEIDKSPALLKSVVQRFDVIPDTENETQHVRQVHPGNYKKKLSDSAIEKLTEKAKDFLTHYNYSL